MNERLTQKFVDLSQYSLNDSSFLDYNFRSWEQGAIMDWHSHQFMQVIHVLEGQLCVDYGDGWNTLRKDTVHVLPPYQSHRLKTISGHYQFGLNFRPSESHTDFLAELLSAFETPVNTKLRFKKSWKHLLLDSNDAVTKLILFKKIHLLQEYCFNLLESMHATDHESLSFMLISFLKDNISSPVNVEAIACSLNTSRATLQRVCKESYGLGVSQLFERVRLEDVVDKLMCSGETIEAISLQAGYKDVSHLSKVFKKKFGLPPGKFRTSRL